VVRRHSALHSTSTPEAAIARLLTIMLVVATILVLVSGVLFLKAEGGATAAYESLAPAKPELTKPGDILRNSFAGKPASLLQLGVLLLLITPLARETVALYSMAKRREWAFVAIAVVVCGILAWGLLGRL